MAQAAGSDRFSRSAPGDAQIESLRLPPQHEPLREHLEETLTPLHNPRQPATAS